MGQVTDYHKRYQWPLRKPGQLLPASVLERKRSHPTPARHTKDLVNSGASVARKFAATYSVALLARNPSNYEPLLEEINGSGGKAIGISTDVSDAKSVKNAFDKITKDMGSAKLAAAVFNVGGKFVRKPFLELSEDDFVSGYDSNGYVNAHKFQGLLLTA